MSVFIQKKRKWISAILIVAFPCLLQVASAPIERHGSGTVSTAAADEESPGLIETTARQRPAEKKKSIMPYILIGVGLVAAAALVYVLVIKKPKYTLTVTVGADITGSPVAGTYTYEKGETVSYSYSTQTFQKDLKVKVDGADASASGSITMNSNHTLDVTAGEGFSEDFSSGASSYWLPREASEWSVSGGYYRCHTASSNFNFNVFNHAWSQSSYTVTSRIMLSQAPGAKGILLATTNNLRAASGYLFAISSSSARYEVYKYDGVDVTVFGSAGASALKSWTDHPAVVAGANQWNTLKVVRAGSNYTFYANDTALYAFSESSHDPRYAALLFEVGYSLRDFYVDNFSIDVGNAPASLPGLPAVLLRLPGASENEMANR